MVDPEAEAEAEAEAAACERAAGSAPVVERGDTGLTST